MKDSLKYVALITQVGLTILITVFFFTVLGVYLDRWLNTKAIFTVVFVIVGCFSGLYVGVQLVQSALPNDSERK